MSQILEIDTLSLAALFREEFSIDWMQELMGHKASKILLALDEGVNQSQIKRKTAVVYSFSDHAKQQELIEALSESVRNHWHGRIADLLKSLDTMDAPILRELAHHLLGSNQNFNNCEALVQTGESLFRAFEHQDALQCFTSAIDTLGAMTGEEADRLFVEAVYLYCRIFTGEQAYEPIIRLIEQALERSERLGFHPKKPLLIMHLAKYQWFSGHNASAMTTFNQGWSLAQAEGNPLVLRQALTLRMFFLWWQGRFRELVDAYEEDRPEVIRLPRSETPILVSSMLGASYVYCGQVTQGVGLLNALYEQCHQRNQRASMIEVACALGKAFIEIGRTDDGIAILEESIAERGSNFTPYTESAVRHYLALAYAVQENFSGALRELKTAVAIESRSVGLRTRIEGIGGRSFFLALAEVDEQLLSAAGIDLDKAIAASIEGRNIHEKGIGYFLKAQRLRKKDVPLQEIERLLLKSIRWIEESGNVIQLAKVRLALARVYLLMRDEDLAKDSVAQASEVLAPINEALIPDELAGLLHDSPGQIDLLESIMQLGNELVAIRDYRELVQRILSTINQITGAERGGLFTIEGDPAESRLKLIAATVLTMEDVEHESFMPAMAIIHKTASTGDSQIETMVEEGTRNDLIGERRRHIRSCFCIPMVLRNELIGVLYHDNSLMMSRVSEADLAGLSYFAGQAAIAIDNAKAYEEIQLLNEQLRKEKDYYVEQHLQNTQYEDFVGVSAAIQRTFTQVEQVAGSDSTVLILGETGVGKELVARLVHQSSSRNGGPFIRVDCSSLAESLINSEMFGHEKGSFTGAIKQHTGRFELADGGTLFLDEIGNIPLDVQTRLLRVLETREFHRIGGSQTIRSDFRLLTATNQDLTELVRAGQFREDLFYRLNVYPITVPPLRDRVDDIPLLAHFFLKNLGVRAGKSVDKITESTMDTLKQYAWPGNVRELKNVIERGVLLSPGPQLRIPDLVRLDSASPEESNDLTLAEMERQHIIHMLNKSSGKIDGPGGAAERLGIHHNTLRSRMKKLGIVRNAQSYVQAEKGSGGLAG